MGETRGKEALLVIDMQKGFDGYDAHWGGARNNPEAEARGLALLKAARTAAIPVLHAHHDSLDEASPLRLDRLTGAPKDGFAPMESEAVFAKHANSGFIGTKLEAHLREAGITDLVLFGLTTDHCVSTTTRMAGNLGFSVRLAGDACATFPKRSVDGGEGDPADVYDAELIHKTALASLHGEFCHVVETQEILKSWR